MARITKEELGLTTPPPPEEDLLLRTARFTVKAAATEHEFYMLAKSLFSRATAESLLCTNEVNKIVFANTFKMLKTESHDKDSPKRDRTRAKYLLKNLQKILLKNATRN
ncbi:MAG: hypothetical protein FWF24_04870 [Alphaproteobacteria bacterium]|nr:hypothetical protein [Alphaproteobacteria bacterium]